MSDRLKRRKTELAGRARSSWRPSGTRASAPGSRPALVLGLIQVESGFRKFAISRPARAATCR